MQLPVSEIVTEKSSKYGKGFFVVLMLYFDIFKHFGNQCCMENRDKVEPPCSLHFLLALLPTVISEGLLSM